MSVDAAEIENLRQTYNREHTSAAPIARGEPSAVWRALRIRLRDKCKGGEGECVVASLLEKSAAPKTWKENPTEWLSTNDIEKVEKNYKRLFSNYEYVGTFPMDFGTKSETGTCLVSALCSMDILKLASKGKTQIGMVFNTDVSTGPGQHWVAVFCDLRPELEYPRMTYFDSYAQRPEKEIQRLMTRWKQAWDASGRHSKPMELTYNKTKHQRKNTECGMYCVYFHYCCLMELPMQKRISDEVMVAIRGALFRI